jgi:signal transduction histidine kinase
LLGRLIPATPGRRRTLNLILLAGVVAPLLLALALVNVFRPSPPAAPPVELTAEQTSRLLEGVMEGHARAVVSMAADSAIGNGGRGADAAYRRLNDLLAVFSDFEGLAVVDRQGQVMASAGVLPADVSAWREVPAFQDSLEHPSGPAISSLNTRDLAWRKGDGVPFVPSRIQRVVFAAPVPGNPSQANSVLLGIMKTETLLDSVQVLLYDSGPGARPVSVSGAQQPDGNFAPVSSAPNLWLASVSYEAPVTPDLEGALPLLRPEEAGDLGQVYRPTWSSQVAKYPWHLVVQTPAAADTARTLFDTVNLATAVAAVALVLIAGGVIWRSGRSNPTPPLPAQPQPQMTAVTPWFGEPPKEMSRRLVAAQESVRREMADYLHGHVQSKLLALSLSLGLCRQALDRDPAGASEMLERVQTELKKVQDEDLRQVSGELYPAIVKFGLAPAMRSLVSRFSESLEIDLTIDPRVGALDLAGEAGIPEKQRLGVYRIAEEALNNVLKHAYATRVEVNLDWREPDHLTMSVVDNGRGFDLDHRPASHGLLMMSDYAEAVDGQTEIVTSPGRGTEVRLAFSLGSWEMAVPLENRLN